MTIKKSRSGFTLIELLVVIAIIGLLAAIVLASLNSARKKSRDARRQADLKQLHSALELYVSEFKVSPTTAQGLAILVTTVPQAIAAVPRDPNGGTGAYGYVQVGASGYALGTALEVPGQIPPLNNDYDTALAITINGVATNCNLNAGLATEAVLCVYWP